MNLIIDVGNSFVKLAIFSNNTLKLKNVVKIEAVLSEILILKEEFKFLKNAIISSVGHLKKGDLNDIASCFDLIILNSELKLPFTNLYTTPKTLGVDRIALVSASVNAYPKHNVLIIDAGTCITYDFINSNNEYLGGAISPGLRMRYKSLNNLTANLPLLETEAPKGVIGNSSVQSIHSGVVNGILNEINGAIEAYTLEYPDLTVILTGGDANFLSKQLKSSIFANPDFLLEGLNYILQFKLNE